MFENMRARPQSLFDQLETMHRLLSRSVGAEGTPGGIRSTGFAAFPEINVARTPTSVEVFAFAPGMDAASIDVTIERNVLRISGERPAAVPPGDAKAQFYANERPSGRFARVVSLPDDVDPLQVDATYRDGVLRVRVGLSKAAQPQRITVQ